MFLCLLISLPLLTLSCPQGSSLNANSTCQCQSDGFYPKTRLENSLTSLEGHFAYITKNISLLYWFLDGENGNKINNGGNNMFLAGNYLYTNIGRPLPYSNKLINSNQNLGTNKTYFTSKFPGLFMFMAEINISKFYITVNPGTLGGTTEAFITSTLVVNGQSFKGFCLRVFGSSGPSINYLIIVKENNLVNFAFPDPIYGDYSLTNLDGVDWMVLLLWSTFDGSHGPKVEDSIFEKIMEIFLEEIYLNEGCLGVCPNSCQTCVSNDTCLSCQSNGFFLSQYQCHECSQNCSLCKNQTICEGCSYGFQLTREGLCLPCDGNCSELSSSTQVGLEVSSKTSEIIRQVTTAFSPGGSMGLLVGFIAKIFSEIKYINITYSEELLEAFSLWDSSFFNFDEIIKVPEDFQRSSTNLPNILNRYGIEPDMIPNCWQTFLMGILIVAFLLFQVLIGKINFLQNHKKIVKFLSDCKIRTQNFGLVQLYGSFGDLFFYFLIGWRNLDSTQTISIWSFSFSIVLLIGLIYVLLSHYLLLNNYQKVKAQGNLEEFCKSNKWRNLFFMDFHDNFISQPTFLLFISIEDLLKSFTLVNLCDFPVAQCMILMWLDIISILYLIKIDPFKVKFEGRQQLVFETISLLVHSIVLMNSIIPQEKKLWGRLILLANFLFSFISITFLLSKILFSNLSSLQKLILLPCRRKARVHSLTENTILKGDGKSTGNTSSIEIHPPRAIKFELFPIE